jgi:hypothetical protein
MNRQLTVVCHACGKVWEREPGGFISSPLALEFPKAGGGRWLVPCWSCKDCRSIPGAISAAYTNFPLPGIQERAAAEWEALLAQEAR